MWSLQHCHVLHASVGKAQGPDDKVDREILCMEQDWVTTWMPKVVLHSGLKLDTSFLARKCDMTLTLFPAVKPCFPRQKDVDWLNTAAMHSPRHPTCFSIKLPAESTQTPAGHRMGQIFGVNEASGLKEL